jgi:hypothetical protein
VQREAWGKWVKRASGVDCAVTMPRCLVASFSMWCDTVVDCVLDVGLDSGGSERRVVEARVWITGWGTLNSRKTLGLSRYKRYIATHLSLTKYFLLPFCSPAIKKHLRLFQVGAYFVVMSVCVRWQGLCERGVSYVSVRLASLAFGGVAIAVRSY